MRPPLKWAGGKRQLLPQLRRFYPRVFHRYVEPFVGSGAVFFDLVNDGALSERAAILLDTNVDLIGCYQTIRDYPDEVIDQLETLSAAYHQDPEGHYYRVRDEAFNPERRRIFDGQTPDPDRYHAALAAQLLFLNRTGFNGLFRVNAKGGFNVPIGRYTNPRICDADNLRAVATALQQRVTLRHAPFTAVLDVARKDDFVYLDPPYAPLSPTADFTSYTAHGFSADDQRRLQAVVLDLARRGCHVLLSNSTAPIVRDLYDTNADAHAVGLRSYTVPARRAINSDASRRGTVPEYLITNLPRHA